MYFRYDEYCWYFYPLISSDKLFLGTEEDDFIIDGYSIRRYADITKAEIKYDKYNEILKSEGTVDSIQIPEVDISTWETAFITLQKMNKNIIVEKESLDDSECNFIIGRIEKVYKKFIYVRHFNGDGIWQEKPYKIPYTDITSVSFKTRYVEVFSKYLNELPK